jgi:hypothetical protein
MPSDTKPRELEDFEHGDRRRNDRDREQRNQHRAAEGAELGNDDIEQPGSPRPVERLGLDQSVHGNSMGMRDDWVIASSQKLEASPASVVHSLNSLIEIAEMFSHGTPGMPNP